MGRSPTCSRSSPIEKLIRISFLAEVPTAARAELVRHARIVDLPAGFFVMRGTPDFGGIVASGLLRVFAADYGEGREVTYRNAVPGETIGLAALLGVDDDVWIQAMQPSSVLALDLETARSVIHRDPAVSLALARETMRRMRDTSRELLIWVRGSVRQRVIRELLDLAASRAHAMPPSIAISHEALADAIGSRREVVTRALGDLARRGTIPPRSWPH